MKKLLKLDGVKALSKMEQKSVFGGYAPKYCEDDDECEYDEICNSRNNQCTVW